MTCPPESTFSIVYRCTLSFHSFFLLFLCYLEISHVDCIIQHNIQHYFYVHLTNPHPPITCPCTSMYVIIIVRVTLLSILRQIERIRRDLIAMRQRRALQQQEAAYRQEQQRGDAFRGLGEHMSVSRRNSSCRSCLCCWCAVNFFILKEDRVRCMPFTLVFGKHGIIEIWFSQSPFVRRRQPSHIVAVYSSQTASACCSQLSSFPKTSWRGGGEREHLN